MDDPQKEDPGEGQSGNGSAGQGLNVHGLRYVCLSRPRPAGCSLRFEACAPSYFVHLENRSRNVLELLERF
ncbi:hypothetical protein L3X38_010764 [Prunus dulcis]|uniref:Uncharacterized protein n=1 Tax=Prunus dulcis TaxID=3755 RepID=A0AAD4WG60_PRUDU|nr:hypothetical protein L3X38_010764 [Prunus dulcis]